MADDTKKAEPADEFEGTNTAIDRPRLTPQGRTSPKASGTDETAAAPWRDEALGQPDPAELSA